MKTARCCTGGPFSSVSYSRRLHSLCFGASHNHKVLLESERALGGDRAFPEGVCSMTSSERIYADYAATTPARPEVIEAMLPYLGEHGYNPSSLHAEGRRARSALDGARESVAACLGAKPKEIIFTGGGSEADNLAIFGIAKLKGRAGRLLSTRIEHHAVAHSLDALADEDWEVDYVEVDERGLVAVDDFTAALGPQTALASIMLANNEIGTVQPIAQLARVAHEHGALFHTDAVQGPVFLKLDVAQLGVDLLSISAHKFYGPKGVGALYVREGTPLAPLLHGGSQEFAKRAGTENVAGIVGMATALQLASAECAQAKQRVERLRDQFEAGVTASAADVRIIGEGAPRLPNISNIAFAGVDADALVMRLDLEGVAVSTGSACAAGSLEPSHVIAALGLDPRWQRSAVRFSFGRMTDAAQIERLIALVCAVVRELRRFSVPTT